MQLGRVRERRNGKVVKVWWGDRAMEQRGLSERGMGQWEERQKDSAKGQGRNGVTEKQSKE